VSDVKRWHWKQEQREYVDANGDECTCNAVVNAYDYDALHAKYVQAIATGGMAIHDRDRLRAALERIAFGKDMQLGRCIVTAEKALRGADQPAEHRHKRAIQFPDGRVYCEDCGEEIPNNPDQTAEDPK
jgi:hypothetical protein